MIYCLWFCRLDRKYSYEEIEANETIPDSIFFRFIQIAEKCGEVIKRVESDRKTD